MPLERRDIPDQEIIEQYLNGASLRRLAETYHTSHNVISRRLRLCGVTLRSRSEVRRLQPAPSVESRAKMAAAHKGKSSPKPPWFRSMLSAKALEHYRGHVHKTPETKRIRLSTEYAEWRQAVFSRDNWTCTHCGRRGGYIEADHIKPFSTHPDLRLDINNGRTLCKGCHKDVTRKQWADGLI